ncbi:hypothetical protein [Anaeropeptidivorans aminofermentans]|jgi:uncharacterized protein Yka (UPF0111/DUF47 family)|uniref:hypothetical protein n=1 Tax=Anaeropeptidivorans aminofermentans TaxID=2934315 RepID=UPI00202474B1|nr:hypothetical protein [Anaeropeptidivorans aminofermentans]MBE6013452.1 hypothetical protein [Lachnospiraceae bacterium]
MNKKQITNKLASSFYRPKKKKASDKKKEISKELEELEKKIDKATRRVRNTMKSLSKQLE